MGTWQGCPTGRGQPGVDFPGSAFESSGRSSVCLGVEESFPVLFVAKLEEPAASSLVTGSRIRSDAGLALHRLHQELVAPGYSLALFQLRSGRQRCTRRVAETCDFAWR